MSTNLAPYDTSVPRDPLMQVRVWIASESVQLESVCSCVWVPVGTQWVLDVQYEDIFKDEAIIVKG